MNDKKKIHIPYFKQLLNQTSLSALNRQYYEKIISSVERQGGYATQRQADVLRKLLNS